MVAQHFFRMWWNVCKWTTKFYHFARLVYTRYNKNCTSKKWAPLNCMETVFTCTAAHCSRTSFVLLTFSNVLHIEINITNGSFFFSWHYAYIHCLCTFSFYFRYILTSPNKQKIDFLGKFIRIKIKPTNQHKNHPIRIEQKRKVWVQRERQPITSRITCSQIEQRSDHHHHPVW